MFSKAKEIIAHPYAAPLAETVKGIGVFALHPLGGFIERIREAFNEKTYRYSNSEDAKKPALLRIYKRLFYTDDSAGFISGAGSVVAGAAGAFIACGMAVVGGAGWLGVTAAGAAALGVGVAAGPFLLAGVIALGAACAGSIIGGLPGFMKGCKMAIDYRKQIKAQGQVLQALPAAAEDPELAKALGKALSPFNDLAPGQRAAYVKMMNQQHADAAKGESEKLLQALDSLPDAERDMLLKGLRPRLKEEFDGLATREANDSTILQKGIEVGSPIRLKTKHSTR